MYFIKIWYKIARFYLKKLKSKNIIFTKLKKLILVGENCK